MMQLVNPRLPAFVSQQGERWLPPRQTQPIIETIFAAAPRASWRPAELSGQVSDKATAAAVDVVLADWLDLDGLFQDLSAS
jgi:hypothetical protein